MSTLFVLGLSHKTAPLSVREQLSAPAHRLEQALAELRAQASIDEVVLVSTCNRVELIGASSEGPEASLRARFCSANQQLATRYGLDLSVWQ